MKRWIPRQLKIATFSGLFYLIDGEIIIQKNRLYEIGNHQALFAEITKKIFPKYQNYNYLTFPRGIVMCDLEDPKEVIASGPKELTPLQRRTIARSFEASRLCWEEDEHYCWKFIEKKIRKDLSYLGDGKEAMQVIENEVYYQKVFFFNQIKQYKGNKKEIYLK